MKTRIERTWTISSLHTTTDDHLLSLLSLAFTSITLLAFTQQNKASSELIQAPVADFHGQIAIPGLVDSTIITHKVIHECAIFHPTL